MNQRRETAEPDVQYVSPRSNNITFSDKGDYVTLSLSKGDTSGMVQQAHHDNLGIFISSYRSIRIE
jgi:hypothetical protein